ncbi:hypothetical protein [Paenibacillus pini]|uniref:Uncharacterized protein n=1 Tax=Paenibacillus pini JCM 16418 TaxID=1236976 RepID=W7YHD5_9BACL|nr:hypothetical protein [Paenibacillus pini]GAF07867.1 hypothetical protein JCM16418_1899 [Paenibacillus pini JCM 16418]
MIRVIMGWIFIFVAIFVFVLRYVIAAMIMSGAQGWNSVIYDDILSYTGKPLFISTIVFLIIGIILVCKEWIYNQFIDINHKWNEYESEANLNSDLSEESKTKPE